MSVTLKDRIKEALNIPHSNFSNYCSDLYILLEPEYQTELDQWLKENYEYKRSIVRSIGNVEGSDWYGKSFLDIPFAYEEDWLNKQGPVLFTLSIPRRINWETGTVDLEKFKSNDAFVNRVHQIAVQYGDKDKYSLENKASCLEYLNKWHPEILIHQSESQS